MIKNIILSFFFLFSFSIVNAQESSKKVLVSIAPYRYLVEEIADGTVSVEVVVPKGASSHHYEPTPKQMLKLTNADIWFQIGEVFENRLTESLRGQTPDLVTIDLRNGLTLLRSEHKCCHNHGPYDLHIWLSPRLMKQQANIITQTLSTHYPENKALYQQNLKKLHNQFDTLDQILSNILRDHQGRTLFVSHPAYAYFCYDYGLIQLPIEYEGKDPSPKQLTNILAQAKALNINTVFIQPQAPSKGAKLVAKQINADVILLDPFSEDYEQNLIEIAKAFARSFK